MSPSQIYIEGEQKLGNIFCPKQVKIVSSCRTKPNALENQMDNWDEFLTEIDKVIAPLNQKKKLNSQLLMGDVLLAVLSILLLIFSNWIAGLIVLIISLLYTFYNIQHVKSNEKKLVSEVTSICEDASRNNPQLTFTVISEPVQKSDASFQDETNNAEKQVKPLVGIIATIEISFIDPENPSVKGAPMIVAQSVKDKDSEGVEVINHSLYASKRMISANDNNSDRSLNLSKKSTKAPINDELEESINLNKYLTPAQEEKPPAPAAGGSLLARIKAQVAKEAAEEKAKEKAKENGDAEKESDKVEAGGEEGKKELDKKTMDDEDSIDLVKYSVAALPEAEQKPPPKPAGGLLARIKAQVAKEAAEEKAKEAAETKEEKKSKTETAAPVVSSEEEKKSASGTEEDLKPKQEASGENVTEEEKSNKKKSKKSKKGDSDSPEKSKERSQVRKKYLLENLTQTEKELKEENEKLRAEIRSKVEPDLAEKLIKKSISKKPAPAVSEDDTKSKKKQQIEMLQFSVKALKKENAKLKDAIQNKIGGNEAAETDNEKTLNWSLPKGSEVDAKFLEELQSADQNFCVTDPSLPDNPIVYATKGFLELTGYKIDEILGRNCRFLQGPETDPEDVAKVRKAVETGSDVSLCLLNYRADGTTFWNLFHISALRDANGTVTNFIGIQCKVDEEYASLARKQHDEKVEGKAT